jgi:hypothetical protein
MFASVSGTACGVPEQAVAAHQIANTCQRDMPGDISCGRLVLCEFLFPSVIVVNQIALAFAPDSGETRSVVSRPPRWLQIGVVSLALAFRLADAGADASPQTAGKHWRIKTERGPIRVWTAPNYDPATARTIVFVHGYGIGVDSAWSEYHLEEQFARSGLNAMFVVCGAPGSLEQGVVWPSLSKLLSEISDGLGEPLPAGELVVVGHSAAYRTLVLWLNNPALHTLVLLDAAYGEEDRFLEWTRDEHHRLINIASDTIDESNWMHAFLPDTKRIRGLPSEWTDEARAARVLYVRTGIGHMSMVMNGVTLPLALRALAP